MQNREGVQWHSWCTRQCNAAPERVGLRGATNYPQHDLPTRALIVRAPELACPFLPAFDDGVTVARAMGTVSQGEVTFTARTAGAAQTALNFTESSLVTIPLVSNSPVLTIAAWHISGAVTLASTTGMAPATGMEYATVSAIGMEYESKGAVLPLVSFTVTAFAGAME